MQVSSVCPGTPAAQAPGLAESADLTLAATPLAAVAGETSQDISAATQSSWGLLPAGLAAIESLGALGQDQPVPGACCLFQRAVCIGARVWEGIPCKRREELMLGARLLSHAEAWSLVGPAALLFLCGMVSWGKVWMPRRPRFQL